MKKLKYLLRCIKNIDLKNMFKIINKIHKKSGKFRIYLFFDIIVCAFKYGTGYYDYQEFEFYLLNKDERKTYLTRVKNNELVVKYNNKKSFYKFDDKGIFNELFKDYIKRDYLILKDKEDLKKFICKHKEIIVKPIDGQGGKGIEIINTKDYKLDDLYNKLINDKQLLIEEVIKQNKEINKLYAKSVNTLRLFTYYDGKKGHILNSVFKIGNGGVTDNFSSGSMYTFVDDNGIILVPAIDQNDNIYDIHPITNEKIVGFKVPFYKEACDLVCDASKIVKDVRYVGWDVAITDNGPVIIEGNSYPGIFQIKPSLMRNMGLIPKYNKEIR